MKKVFQIIPVLFGILSLTFFLLHVAPGDPTGLYIKPGISQEVLEQLHRQFGFQDSPIVQFWKWVKNLLTLDFGYSYSYFRPVRDVLFETIPNTLSLTIPALFVEYFLGILGGILMAVFRRRLTDNVLSFLNMIVYSLPGFWFALMSIIIFALKLGWVPPSGLYSSGYEDLVWSERLVDRVHHLILPVIILGIGSAASTARFVRGSMLDVLRQPYILTARAKGLNEKRILFVHALRNVLLSVITLGFISVPALLGGAVVLEWIFALPGMGRMTVEAIFARDFPLVMASTVLASIAVLVSNLSADIFYQFVDPRIKMEP